MVQRLVHRRVSLGNRTLSGIIVKIRLDIFGGEGGGKDLENRVNWVKSWSVYLREGWRRCNMVEDIIPDLTSASGTQLQVSPEGAR